MDNTVYYARALDYFNEGNYASNGVRQRMSLASCICDCVTFACTLFIPEYEESGKLRNQHLDVKLHDLSDYTDKFDWLLNDAPELEDMCNQDYIGYNQSSLYGYANDCINIVGDIIQDRAKASVV